MESIFFGPRSMLQAKKTQFFVSFLSHSRDLGTEEVAKDSFHRTQRMDAHNLLG